MRNYWYQIQVATVFNARQHMLSALLCYRICPTCPSVRPSHGWIS